MLRQVLEDDYPRRRPTIWAEGGRNRTSSGTTLEEGLREGPGTIWKRDCLSWSHGYRPERTS